MNTATDERRDRLSAISSAWSAGNHAEAYVTRDVATALDAWRQELAEDDDEPSPAEEDAFIVGFFSSYETHEMGESEGLFTEALASVGADLSELGITRSDDDSEEA